jgi:hypothetical protein
VAQAPRGQRHPKRAIRMSARTDAAYAAELAGILDQATGRRDHDQRTVIDRIRNNQNGTPGARPTDTTNGTGATPWCWHHQREITACRRLCKLHLVPITRCRTAGRRCYLTLGCVGTPVDVGGDTTGELALRPDQAAADLAQVEKDWRTVRHARERIAGTYSRYTPRPATAVERRLLTVANEGTPGCDSCARTEVEPGVPRWVPPLTDDSSTVGGLLDEPRLLCRWCYDHVVRTDGLVPNVAELEDHHDGKRVNCPHPKADTKANAR